ncbi:MAG TPA: serine/threonine-protein kinase, partial [Candidatus Obscuribacter sp.]|nr:serine/threonine-protein kinase [Candidatus Obscuribacter sp.]
TINREGIELDFWTDIMSTETDRVKFSDVEKVELVGASDSANPEKLEILVTTKPRETPLGPLASVLTLKLSAIRKADREKFLKALEEFAPARATSSEVVEALKEGAENSYTELWLQSLNESAIRKNIQPLCEGDLLQEGRYQIVRRLGIGGEGTAYEAFDRSNLAHGKVERIVLKETIMPPYSDRPQEQESLSRIKKESEILSSLNSPLVVACHGFFLEDRRSYLVLEYIEGENLRELVRKQLVKQQGAMEQEQVIELALIMCDILTVLHDNQIIHRDFTPDNLIYKAERTNEGSVGQLKLIDFAVATQDKGGTTGTIVGKHSYVPPEQFRGHAQYRSDIYSMAATIYYLLTGQDPEPITQANLDHRKDLCPALVELIKAATSQNPEERPESARQFKEMLLNIKTQIADENQNSTSEVDQEPLKIKIGEREKEELRWQNSA